MAARFYNFLSADSDSSWTLLSIVGSQYFTLVMLAVVLSNTIVMIFETYDSFYENHLSFFIVSERIYLTIYIIESGLKLWAYSWKFFKNLWNCFDLLIIGISIVDLITYELTHDNTQSSLVIEETQSTQIRFERINHFLRVLRVLRVLRSFRALRVLRTIRFIQSIHTIVKTCSKALPAMASIIFIMVIITCISAILARSLFGDLCPERFSNLVKTFFSLFVLLTLDDWYSIYQVCEEKEYSSFQLIFCLIYIFIINFILLNLLMAVLVDSFQHTLDDDTKKQNQRQTEHNTEQRISKNLTQLVKEYCAKRASTDEQQKVDPSSRTREEHKPGKTSKEHRREQSLPRIEKLLSRYYTYLENLEFRMERHEQLTKFAQKSVKLILDEQDNRKSTLKK